MTTKLRQINRVQSDSCSDSHDPRTSLPLHPNVPYLTEYQPMNQGTRRKVREGSEALCQESFDGAVSTSKE